MDLIQNIIGFKEKAFFETDLSPEACLEKIMESKDPAMKCTFDEKGFRLYIRRRNRLISIPGIPNFYGTIKSQGKGSRIEGYFGYAPGALFEALIIVSFFLFFLVVLSYYLPHLIETIGIIVFSLIILPIGMLWNRAGYSLQGSVKTQILKFLERTLGLKPWK